MCLLSLFSFRHLDEVEVYHEDHELILTHISESLDMVMSLFTACLTALISDDVSCRSSQDSIRSHHSFDAFPFNFCFFMVLFAGLLCLNLLFIVEKKKIQFSWPNSKLTLHTKPN
jgi:virulence-associated protein VagC